MNNWLLYLLEFRRRVLFCLGILGSLFLLFFIYSKPLIEFVVAPLLNKLPPHGKIVATTVTAPFLIPIKISLIAATLLGMPFFIYQLWMFIQPALYPHERKYLMPLLVWSIGLFYIGVAFAYYLFLPLIFQVLLHMMPATIVIMTDINHYIGFISRFIFAFGVAFELPIIILVLVMAGIVSHATLKTSRPYVIILAFVLGMLLTPPDVISQVLMAIPLWGLFELGLVLAKLFERKQLKT